MLDAGIYEQLSRLVIAMKQKSSQNMAGNRRSVQKGTSAEFSDFREYMPGDDLRRLDWNVYARSERMYIREYFEEKEAVVSVILDTSASMHYGKKSKAELAQDLCAVIAFLTLHHMDRLVLYDSSQMGTPLVVSGGKNALPKVLGWLQARTFSGTETDSFSAVRQMQRRGAGVTVIVSDFLTEAATDPTQDCLEKNDAVSGLYETKTSVASDTVCGRTACDNGRYAQSDRYGVQRKTARDDACGCDCAL